MNSADFKARYDREQAQQDQLNTPHKPGVEDSIAPPPLTMPDPMCLRPSITFGSAKGGSAITKNGEQYEAGGGYFINRSRWTGNWFISTTSEPLVDWCKNFKDCQEKVAYLILHPRPAVDKQSKPKEKA